MEKIQKQDLPAPYQKMVRETEDNIEKLLLHLCAICPNDVPVVKWKGDEWQPDLLNDDIYPQFHRGQESVLDKKSDRPILSDRYEVLWALPLCGRDQTVHWHDKLGFDEGTAKHVLLFQWKFNVLHTDSSLRDSRIEICFGMYDGFKEPGRSMVSVYVNEHGNTIPVELGLLVSMVKHIRNLREHVNLEDAMARIMARMAEHLG